MIYRFNKLELDTGQMELRRDGRAVEVEPKVFDLLVCLVDRRDRVVTKEELQDIVWPQVIVAESALTRSVMKARRAVGDNADDPEIIRTVRGRGYRFVAPVMTPDIAPVTGDTPSVAVTPFESLSEHRERKYVAAGMTEDLIALLARLTGLRTVSGTDSQTARYVVSGSIRPIGDNVRINVQLVERAGGARVWAEIYNRAADDIDDIQENVAATIAATLGNEVFREEAARARQSDRQTLDAYGLLARSMAYYHSGFRRDHSMKSIELCREAVALAPEDPRALGSLALHLAMLVANHWSVDANADRDLAMSSGRKAMDIDSGNDWVLFQWGAVNGYLGNPERGIGILERSLELNPNQVSALAQMGRCLIGVGRAEESLGFVERAIDLSPRDLNSFAMYLYIARAHLQLGNYGKSVAAAQRSIDINNSWNFAWFIHALAMAAAGNADGARESLQRCRELEPEVDVENYRERLVFAGGGDSNRVSQLSELLDEAWQSH